MLTFLMRYWPYLVAVILGIAIGGGSVWLVTSRRLAMEQAAHARDRAQHAKDLKAISDAAFAATRKAQAEREAAQHRIETLDSRITQESQRHETENRHYRDDLATGAERLRIAVAHCAAGRDRMPDVSASAGMDDGGAAYADLDPAVAGRVFRVADDDQREIDKLRALQGYVCAIRPETQGCPRPAASP